MDTERDRDKLGYMCIRTAVGTKAFTSAIMGLLGMDVYQDELTDKLLGDLASEHLHWTYPIKDDQQRCYAGYGTKTMSLHSNYYIVLRCCE